MPPAGLGREIAFTPALIPYLGPVLCDREGRRTGPGPHQDPSPTAPRCLSPRSETRSHQALGPIVSHLMPGGGSLLLTLKPPSEFCWSSWMLQAEVGWVSLFSLPVVLQGWRLGLGCSVHRCPASCPSPQNAAWPSLSICTPPAGTFNPPRFAAVRCID